MTKSNLVPRPWKYEKGMVKELWVILGVNQGNVRIAGVKDEIHAEYITNACNAFPDLVEALEKAAISGKGEIDNEWYCPVCGSHSFYDYDMDHTSECFIGQALAKAKAGA